MTMTTDAAPNLDYREQVARIDRELATHSKLRLETKTELWKVAFAGMTAGAALFAAGAAFMKLLGF